VEAFDVLGDPVRRRIVELLAGGERGAGDIVDVIQVEFRITQPAVSRHLRVLRESGFAQVRAEGARRLYVLNSDGLDGVESWLVDVRRQWSGRLDALETELARGRRHSPEHPRRSTPDG
jgi:DNA-binding transcriptional ArsR family regulator